MPTSFPVLIMSCPAFLQSHLCFMSSTYQCQVSNIDNSHAIMTHVSDYESLRLPMSKSMSRHLLPSAPSSINIMPFFVSNKLSIVYYLLVYHPFKYQDNHFSLPLINPLINQVPRSRQLWADINTKLISSNKTVINTIVQNLLGRYTFLPEKNIT
ncbi:hypothetical protein V8B55DRAFT_1065027 [Mucor lusitanicus]